MSTEQTFSAPISHEIWDRKYRFKRSDGAPIDSTLDDTFWRVARAAATPEKGGKRAKEKWAQRFHASITDLGFLPAGRILAGAGSGRSVTLFNCFVLGTIEDDLGAIFSGVKMRSRKYSSRLLPESFSTSRPSQSTLVP